LRDHLTELTQRYHRGLLDPKILRGDFDAAVVDHVPGWPIGPGEQDPMVEVFADVHRRGEMRHAFGQHASGQAAGTTGQFVSLQFGVLPFARSDGNAPDELPLLSLGVLFIGGARCTSLVGSDFTGREKQVVDRRPTEAERIGLWRLARKVTVVVDRLIVMHQAARLVGIDALAATTRSAHIGPTQYVTRARTRPFGSIPAL
jgi:hypothetical protein